MLGFILLSFICYNLVQKYRVLIDHSVLASNSEPLVLEIKPNTSARAFVNLLYEHHLISSEVSFLALIRFRGVSHHLQAGIYQINPGESAVDVLAKVVSGDVLLEPFRILEGSTLSDLRKNLIQSPYLNGKNIDFSVISDGHLTAEGLLLADTYYYKAGSEANVLLKQANQHLLTYLDQVWQARDRNLPYKNAYELLIAASIIEKEASLPVERQIISGIIAKRLTIKMPLQMDPTVLYALANQETLTQMQDDVTVLNHQNLKIDSPYNTYRYRGLPPTPIAMVGKQSLDEAAHPTYTEYLYFVAKGDGSHQFSKTYQAQQQAIHQFKLRATTP